MSLNNYETARSWVGSLLDGCMLTFNYIYVARERMVSIVTASVCSSKYVQNVSLNQSAYPVIIPTQFTGNQVTKMVLSSLTWLRVAVGITKALSRRWSPADVFDFLLLSVGDLGCLASGLLFCDVAKHVFSSSHPAGNCVGSSAASLVAVTVAV